MIARLARHGEEILAGAALVVVVAAVCWGVLTRYVTEQPAAWAGEVAQIAFAWMVFVGAAAGFKHRMHISIDMLINALPRAARCVAQRVGELLVVAFLGYAIWLAVLFNIEAWNVPTSVLRLPTTVMYASVLVGLACMALRYVQAAMRGADSVQAPMRDSGAPAVETR